MFLFWIFCTTHFKRDCSRTTTTTILNAVKCNLTELTTKSACVPLVVSSVVTYAHVPEFHVLVDRSVALHTGGVLWHFVAWQLIAQAVPLHPSPSLFPLFQQCDRCRFLLLRGGSWLGCQDLPAMGAVFI